MLKTTWIRINDPKFSCEGNLCTNGAEILICDHGNHFHFCFDCSIRSLELMKEHIDQNLTEIRQMSSEKGKKS